jgi:hypothetical protein
MCRTESPAEQPQFLSYFISHDETGLSQYLVNQIESKAVETTLSVFAPAQASRMQCSLEFA